MQVFLPQTLQLPLISSLLTTEPHDSQTMKASSIFFALQELLEAGWTQHFVV
jgi:hypothetical protein